VDLRAIAPLVRCPTLITHVREDGRVPFAQGRELAALIPGARFVPLESPNHVLLEGEPAWRQFADEVHNFLSAEANKSADRLELLTGGLTKREYDVVELVAQGLDNGTIGAQLRISEKTVRNHVSAVLSKLGVRSRAQAIVHSRNAGYGRKT
jgi:DNA-binding NarL/FixJ family response regulator